MQLIGDSAAKWLSLTRKLFIPVALIFLAYSAWHANANLAPLLTTLSWPRLLLACVCWSAAQWVGPLSTTAFASMFGLPLGYRQLALISVLRLPAKYLPGGIWQSVARFSAYRELKVKDADSLSMLVAEHLIALGVSLVLGGGLLLCIDTTAGMDELAPWIFASGLVILALTTLWFTKKQADRRRILARMAWVMMAAILFWCLAAVAFCTYWQALFGSDGTEIIRIASCYLLSWAAGFIAVFAPQGLGVFEWVAAHLLPSTQALSVTVTVAAGFRLVTVFGDLTAWIIGLLISRKWAAVPHQPERRAETTLKEKI